MGSSGLTMDLNGRFRRCVPPLAFFCDFHNYLISTELAKKGGGAKRERKGDK